MNMRTIIISQCLVFAVSAVACCGSPSGDSDVETTVGALTHSTVATLMPFGGRDGTCVGTNGNSLQVAACNASATQQFVFNGAAIQTATTPTLCLDVRFGDLSAGVVDLT